MEVHGEIGKPEKNTGGQVCQICGDAIGKTVDGDLFVACDVCGFPVCRPCYEYERKDGNQSCPQCKTKYKRLKGSPPVNGEEGDDEGTDYVSEFNNPTSNQEDKAKAAEGLLNWHTYGRGDDVGPPKYDSGEIPRNHIPMITHSRGFSAELLGASPDHMMSPGGGGGKRIHPLPYQSPNSSREFSGGLGNVAWRERVDGWKMKQEKNVLPTTNGTSHPPSEGRGGGDIDATTDYNMDDALL